MRVESRIWFSFVLSISSSTFPLPLALTDPSLPSPQECKRNCPVVRMGKACIVVTPKSKVALFSEELCIGCGICVKKCPFQVNDANLFFLGRPPPSSIIFFRRLSPRPTAPPGQSLGIRFAS